MNPPWLHVAVPLQDKAATTNAAKKKSVAQQKWNRRFYFKLSRDPDLKAGVIESGPKRWSFYNPYRRLEAGAWYWTYGVAAAEAPDKPVWCGKTFTFRITGTEHAGEI